MREKKTFAQRTRTRNTDEVRKKYFLIGQGLPPNSGRTESEKGKLVKRQVKEKIIQKDSRLFEIIFYFAPDGYIHALRNG